LNLPCIVESAQRVPERTAKITGNKAMQRVARPMEIMQVSQLFALETILEFMILIL